MAECVSVKPQVLPPDYSVLCVLSHWRVPLVSMRDWRKLLLGSAGDYFRSTLDVTPANSATAAKKQTSRIQQTLSSTQIWYFARAKARISTRALCFFTTSRKDLISYSEGRHIRPVFRCFIPPSWKWSSKKADVQQLLRVIRGVNACILRVAFNAGSRWTFSPHTHLHHLLGFGCLYCKLVGHVDGATLPPSAFSSAVLDLKLANGC